ncbi:MAG: hypothetical protein R3C68_19780 [Myxococcota bacterium]
MSFSAASLFASVVVSAMGLGFFLYGKRQNEPLQLIAGATLMIFPYFVESAGWVTCATACGNQANSESWDFNALEFCKSAKVSFWNTSVDATKQNLAGRFEVLVDDLLRCGILSIRYEVLVDDLSLTFLSTSLPRKRQSR